MGGTLLLTVLWLGWQTPLFFMIGTASQVGRSVIVYTLALLAWSLIMTWLYNSSGGSTLTAVLFHASANVLGYTVPFDAGLTVLLVLLLLGCGAIVLYPRPLLLRTFEETQGSVTDIETADTEAPGREAIGGEVSEVEASYEEAADTATIDEQLAAEKGERERRQEPEDRAIQMPGHSGETSGAYEGSDGDRRESEDIREGLSGVLKDVLGNARRGRFPDSGGGWAVLLMSGAALIGGSWLLVRRFTSSG